MNNKLSAKLKSTATILLILLMASITLSAIPVNAQSVFYPVINGVDLRPTGLREDQMPAGVNYGWGIRLPAGVTPDVTYHTRAYVNFAPNPVGIDQQMMINVFYTPSSQRVYKTSNYTITITKPDGTKVVFDTRSWTSERTSYVEYTPDQVGIYNVTFLVPDNYWPRGIYYDYTSGGCYNMTSSMYGLASTTTKSFVVQQEQVFSWPPSPLPADYWMRPVTKEHREWGLILGSYPPTGYNPGQAQGADAWDKLYPDTNPAWSDRYHFAPFILAPNSAHIVWKQVQSIAGIVGGEAGQMPNSGTVDQPSVFYAGRCYMTTTKVMNVLINGTYRQQPTSVAECFDIRTGQVYYDIPIADGGVTPTIVSYLDPAPIDTPFYGTSSTWSVELLAFVSNRLIKVNPSTGAISGNFSIAPFTGTGGTFYRNGDGTGLGPYVLFVQNIGNTTNPNYRLIKWTTRGTAANLVDRVISNTSYARSSLPTVTDWNAGIGADVNVVQVQSTYLGSQITTYNVWTGALLQNISDSDMIYVPSNYVADHGKIALYMKQDAEGTKGGYYKAWDMLTGKLEWTGDQTPYPWGECGFAAYSVSSGYGKIVLSTYAGVAAWDWKTGKLSWIYQDTGIPFESPYHNEDGTTINPFFNRVDIVDGKAFAVTIEHGETSPYYRGWGLRAINITTGELVWKISTITGGTGFDSQPIGVYGDGYAIGSSGQDGTMYCYGIGKSATTVTAAPKTIANGASVLIEGTVTDQSPAQPGTPCVSKASMTLQMEYLHLQNPIGGIYQNETITGVPVALTAIGSDGTAINIGTATTNGYYGTFSMAWTPPKQDTYTITATFAADESYGSSGASTAVTVGPAPTIAPTQEPTQAPADNTGLLYATLAAVIIAIAISLFTLFRKR